MSAEREGGRAASTTRGPLALVTGANRGLGHEVARLLAMRGASVLLTGRDAARALDAAAALAATGLRVQARTLDVRSDASVRALAAAVAAEHGWLDILVCNAAVFLPRDETVLTADLAVTRDLFETNLYGVWRVCQACVPLLRRSEHGRIVIVSSGAGSHGDPRYGLTTANGTVASYAISKAALNALTAKLAAELAGSGVLVNAVCPGLTATAPGMEQLGARPVGEGAAGIVWAATLPDDGPSGGFFRDGQSLPW